MSETAVETTVIDVIVHKANIPLRNGESIGQFTRELSDAGRKHVLQKLNIAGKEGGAFMVEAFADKVIFATFKDFKEPTKHHAFKFTRDRAGNFEFGSLTEVKRVTTFKPKDTFPIKKSVNKAGHKKTDDDAQEKGGGTAYSVPKPKNKKEDVKKFAGDWVETSKSFWGSML